MLIIDILNVFFDYYYKNNIDKYKNELFLKI